MMAKDYIQKKGWEFKEERDQYIIRICPFCGDQKWHFGMSQAEGLYSCWICQARGTMRGLMRHLVDETTEEGTKKAPTLPVSDSSILSYHNAFLESDEAKDYIVSRGISLETAQNFNLCHKKGWIGIPSFRNGKCIVIKWRSLPPAKKSFLREPSGAESMLYNEDALSLPNKEIIVTEGEIDALTLLDRGIRNVVSVPNGASSIDPDWVKRLRKKKKVYLAFDPDRAGQSGSETLAALVGEGRCFRVSLPEGEDPNEYFKKHSIEDFNKLLDGAEPFGKPNVVDYDWVYEERLKWLSTGDAQGLSISIPPVDRVCGPLMPGNVYILSSYPKVGKTILSTNIAWMFARKGIPSLMYCLEMSPMEIADIVLHQEQETEIVGHFEWDNGLGIVGARPLFFGWNPKPLKWQDTLEVIRQECRDRGIKFLVIDNFHYLCRAEKDIIGVEGIVSREIKMLSTELHIPVWLIVHPRKKDGQVLEEKIPNFHDLRGSSALSADSSAVLILHRRLIPSDNGDEADIRRAPIGIIRNDAERFGGGATRHLYLDGPKKTWREPSELELRSFAGKTAARTQFSRAGKDRASGDQE